MSNIIDKNDFPFILQGERETMQKKRAQFTFIQELEIKKTVIKSIIEAVGTSIGLAFGAYIAAQIIEGYKS